MFLGTHGRTASPHNAAAWHTPPVHILVETLKRTSLSGEPGAGDSSPLFCHPAGHGQGPAPLRLRARQEGGWPEAGPVPSCSGGPGSSPGQEGASAPVSHGGKGEKALKVLSGVGRPGLWQGRWLGRPPPSLAHPPKVTCRGPGSIPGGLAKSMAWSPAATVMCVSSSVGRRRPGGQ